MVERQPSWDKYEAAILLEGLLASMKGELTRSAAIKLVSRDLREMALHRGVEIDEVYRNANGISFQMKSMESAYLGCTVFKPATKLFADVAGLYHESYDEYQKLLKEARAMISDRKNVEDDFMRYLAERVSPAQLSELYRCYSEIETFCLKIKVLQNPLFETTDFETIKKVQRTIEQNKIFRVTRRRQINKIVDAGRHYYNYIKEGLDARITAGKTVEDRSNIDYEMPNQSPPDIEAEAESPATAYTKTEQDERLLQKHPAVYNQIYNALKASHESQRVTIREMCEAINHTARPAVVEEILDNVSWASNIGDSYIFSENTPAIEPDTSNTESSHSQDTTFEAHQRKLIGNDATCEINSRSFSRYLSETLNMADATCRSYSSAINNCEAFAREHHLTSWKLYTKDKQTAQETIQLLHSILWLLYLRFSEDGEDVLHALLIFQLQSGEQSTQHFFVFIAKVGARCVPSVRDTDATAFTSYGIDRCGKCQFVNVSTNGKLTYAKHFCQFRICSLPVNTQIFNYLLLSLGRF